MPLASAADYASFQALIPFHLVSARDVWQSGLFGIRIAFGVSLAVGLWTRASVIASWLILSTIQARNPLVLYGADMLFAVILCWGIFLSLGALDGVRMRGVLAPAKVGSVISCGTAAFVVQIAAVYFFSFLSKNGDTWISW
ncbi:MAG: hypothetical protein M2R45_01901 [Verrucomicrobia subdivision 3 bacterium]|nr:hypothetical protein [Limisphaerales bacterium]MCS1415699.1 hypothetical protein [Limisphaerales bacterium]